MNIPINSIHSHTTRLATSNNLLLPRVNSSPTKCSLTFVGSIVWSSIPNNIKSSTMLTFKWKLKKHPITFGIKAHSIVFFCFALFFFCISLISFCHFFTLFNFIFCLNILLTTPNSFNKIWSTHLCTSACACTFSSPCSTFVSFPNNAYFISKCHFSTLPKTGKTELVD